MWDWKTLLVAPDAPIEEAIRIINAGGMGIALAVDERGKLLGTVTDGDVRRAIIAHVPLTEPVNQIMNKAPHVVHVGAPREQVLALMHTYHHLQMPVIDSEGCVVGVETLQKSGQGARLDNWVFLMAGGFGRRLRPLTDNLPKPMLEIGGKPVLETIIENFLAYGFHRFCIAVHYMPEAIKRYFGAGERWNATIRYVEEETPLGTAGALSLLPDTAGLPVLVMNGDLLTRVNFLDLLRFHQHEAAAATMCGRGHDYQVPYGVVDAEGHEVRRIVEKPIHRFFVNAGIYIVAPEVIHDMPRGQPLDMPDLLQNLIDRKQRVRFFPIHEYWLDIGQIADFERAQSDHSE